MWKPWRYILRPTQSYQENMEFVRARDVFAVTFLGSLFSPPWCSPCRKYSLSSSLPHASRARQKRYRDWVSTQQNIDAYFPYCGEVVELNQYQSSMCIRSEIGPLGVIINLSAPLLHYWNRANSCSVLIPCPGHQS